MNKLKRFFTTSLLGGIIVILPVVILFIAANWIFRLITGLIQPMTNVLLKTTGLPEIVADIIVIALILIVFFIVGVFVRTKMGKWIYSSIEDSVLKVAPGYTLIKETVLQFIGNKKPPFSSVALVRIFQNDTLVSGFITDTHEDGTCTVFVPTGPNPTSGNIYHVPKESVYIVDVPVETAMRTIISCGAGSKSLVEDFRRKIKPD